MDLSEAGSSYNLQKAVARIGETDKITKLNLPQAGVTDKGVLDGKWRLNHYECR